MTKANFKPGKDKRLAQSNPFHLSSIVCRDQDRLPPSREMWMWIYVNVISIISSTDACRLGYMHQGKMTQWCVSTIDDVSQATNCASSPFSAISWTISNPPTSSPFTINWGNVGQSFKTFSPKNKYNSGPDAGEFQDKNHAPCLTLSSVKISKWLNAMFFSLSNAEIFRENPQRGSSGLPFMNKTTLAWSIRPRSLAFSSSVVSFSLSWSADGTTTEAFAGDWSVRESGVYPGDAACLATDCVSIVALAPDIRSKRVWP